MQDLYPFDKSVHDLTIKDLQKLVDDKVKASYYIEYHNISDNETDQMRKPKINKIVRAITSFANTKGGWCILGVNADDKYGTMSLKVGTTLKQINAYYNSIEKQIDSELFSKIERKDIPLENTAQSNLVSVIYIPCQSGKNFVFKEDNNSERIYRRFNDAFVPFPDICGQTVQPFYQYHRIEDIPEQINENKSTFNQDQHGVRLKIKNIWRLREFHQDNEFKIEKLNELKEYMQPQKAEQIIVYNIDDLFILVDGFYRVAASIEANFEEIHATVKVGTKEEALQESCTANKGKGKEKRSLATRVRTLETYLAAKGYSINDSFNHSEVARSINIEQKFIREYKRYINNNISNTNQEEVFSLSDIIQTFGFKKEELDRWIRIIERKKQVIIYGPPGTGKTFLAKELAKHLTETEDKGDRWNIVQFHPAYSYEDFMQGIRPEIVKEKSQDELSTDDQLPKEVNGQIKYKWEDGIFLQFCQKADKYNSDEDCVLIIDEINRANLSSVFGELMYLLEYRGEKIKLAGNGREFEIPENVRIIGTMNTADRSVSPIDNALRRRFAFLHLPPNTKILYSHYQETNFPVEKLEEALNLVNSKITDENFKLGVSFFLNLGTKNKDNKDKNQEDYIKDIEDIWKMEIEPYLKANSFINKELSKLTWDEKIYEYFPKQNRSD
ncbi:AAA family ATPase [Floridanema evergladense]|uniref:AAA family ATPase n=1 Tax=Floridaenema evergladense BLCC-F167 TaxID=3153639 RepID=A0ABV4WGF9_9CYAN